MLRTSNAVTEPTTAGCVRISVVSNISRLNPKAPAVQHEFPFW